MFTPHLVNAIDNAGEYVELSVEDRWGEGLFTPALTVEDGEVETPDGPGWGVELDPDWLAAADREADGAVNPRRGPCASAVETAVQNVR